MRNRRVALFAAAAVVAVVAGAIVVGANAMRSQPPEAVALEYGRALYASDAEALWRLISDQDRGAKDEATFRRQQQDVRGFAREALRELAHHITGTPTKVSVTDGTATVTLRLRLPDANAAEIRTLMNGWDEDRLDALTAAERQSILTRIADLRRQGTLPMIEGEETFDLRQEAGVWRVWLHGADGVRVRFAAGADPRAGLDVSVTPAQAMINPGERIRVTVHATNRGAREVTTRVSHRTNPESDSNHLALLLCPLFVPVTLAPGETREFTSEYLLLGDAPKSLRALDVTYVFPAGEGS